MIRRFEELLLFPKSLVFISELYLKARDCNDMGVGRYGGKGKFRLFSCYFLFYFYYIKINIYNK